MKQHLLALAATILLVMVATQTPLSLAQGDTAARPDGWREDSHGSEVDPDYAVVFPTDEVNTITITITPDNWQAILDDMTELYGGFGSRPGADRIGGGFPGDRLQPPGGSGLALPPEGFQPPEGDNPGQVPPGGVLPGGFRPLGGAGENVLGIDQNPIWVTATIEFNGQTWTNIGFRLKGNSSLMSSWSGGLYKLPFKLDFDQFEDDHPEIENQRFFGFQQLSFSSNWSDDSLLRERVTADIFREAGVPASHTAFYAVTIDHGSGPIYFGLYTAVEVVDDTVIETQFSDDSGNLYKPEGSGATFALGAFSEESFDKETNQDEEDYSDILALFAALHDETRTTDPEAWRAQLEAVFDVDVFLRWLAVNTLVQNWDTYGRMAHNYYLYNDPADGLLTWIPWDNNMALSEGFGGGFGRGRQNDSPASSALDLSAVDAGWSLIRFLMDDPVYQERYVEDVEEIIQGAFEPARMEATYRALHDLVAPYVVGEDGEIAEHTLLSSPQAFESSVAELIAHVNARYDLALDYLASQASQ
ncbi:MAG: CotH kinase family protein [Anaerolineae bacterium]|nr:CotH kinase family protein [Anaerolineae bacterium]